MIFSFEERPESRQQTMNPPSQTRVYKAVGEQSDAIVSAYALGAVPNTVFTDQGTLYKQDIRIDPDGYAQYVVTVPYGPKQKQNGSYSWSFDTTGATVKVKAAKEHVASYPTGDADPHLGSIGVKSDGDVEGAEIVIPALKLSVQFRHPQGIVTLAFARALANVTGSTNSQEFLGFPEGELLYIGSTGSDGSEAEAEISYQFIASANADDLTIGEITGIVKEGHHYAWIEFQDEVSDDEKVVQPKRVHIERVYDAVDFAAIFGWS